MFGYIVDRLIAINFNIDRLILFVKLIVFDLTMVKFFFEFNIDRLNIFDINIDRLFAFKLNIYRQNVIECNIDKPIVFAINVDRLIAFDLTAFYRQLVLTLTSIID